MALELGIDAGHAGQSRNGCNLPALEIQVVAPEDVPEQVPFQKPINGGSKSNILSGGRRSYQPCLNFRSEIDAASEQSGCQISIMSKVGVKSRLLIIMTFQSIFFPN